jgi:hypothetical protein
MVQRKKDELTESGVLNSCLSQVRLFSSQAEVSDTFTIQPTVTGLRKATSGLLPSTCGLLALSPVTPGSLLITIK